MSFGFLNNLNRYPDKVMRLLKVILLVCMVVGLSAMQCCLAGSAGLPEPNSAGKGVAVTKNITPNAEQAQNKARYAQVIAHVASRMALEAAENARQQTKENTPNFNVVTNDLGYHYVGGWKNNLPHNIGYNGYGMLTWPNGNRYEGEFLNGHKHGSGVFIGANGDRYLGAFFAGEIDGYGSYIYPNGDRYEGEYHHNNRYGYGVMIYHNGERYEGAWRDNEKYGYGVLSSYRGTVEYAGIW